MQRALDHVESSAPEAERRLYVGMTDAPTIARTNAFALRRTQERAPFVHLTSRRGPFMGYVAMGEGGVAFLDSDGELRWPTLGDVRTALGRY
jgi:hypothetical protein